MMRFAPALLLAALIVASPSAQAQWRGNGYRPAPYYAGPGPSFGIGIVAGMLPLVAGAICGFPGPRPFAPSAAAGRVRAGRCAGCTAAAESGRPARGNS
jgi:hypothetical protein